MIKIALTNLGKYNEGQLIFEWLELPFTQEELDETLKNIKIDGVQYEEYFITDYETDIEGLKIGEYENLNQLNELAETLENMEEYEQEELEAIFEELGNFEEALECHQKGNFQYYSGVDSLSDLAEQMVDEGLFGDIPKSIVNYIDYEAIGRDLGFDGYSVTKNGVIRID